ncbi:hypothetical protein BV372_07025 [Nostoc sp. T09]|uniref:hypothetical protein n=1 Tax=Nostoc sp. T09 TaxID=1932621 RepID=UPI000A370FF9|nr:hypothetical protein [Nostoc sp. T09]OUL36512.1 hypothetical protein BV372_07025 [Nostoc sp. T09]
MHIIQPVLGTKVEPLGVRKPLGYFNRLLSRKESSSLHGHSNTIKPLANHLPLATYSQFLLSHDNQAFSDSFIDGNSPEPEYINADFPLIQFDTVDSFIEDSNNYNNENIQSDIPNTLFIQNANNTNNITPELNIKAKSKSKKTGKSRSSQAKSKAKSQKNVDSSANDNLNRQIDEIPIINNFNDVGLLNLDTPPVAVANIENYQASTSQSNIVVDNSKDDNNYVGITPIDSLVNSPIVDAQSVLIDDFVSDETQVLSELATIVNAANIPESIMLSPQKTALETIASDSPKTSSIEPHVIKKYDIFTLLGNLNNSEKTVVDEASQAVDVSDISISLTSPQPEVVTNPNSLRQEKVFSPQQQEGFPHKISNFEEVTGIATDLISNSLPDRNSLSDTTPASVEDAPNLFRDLANEEQPLVSEISSAIPSLESSTTVNSLGAGNTPTVSTSEIISSQTTGNLPVQLAPTSPVIADNSIVASELQSASVNFVDTSENVTPVQTDSVSNIPFELTPISPVIVDNPIVTSESQSASVNFVDVSENVTPVQTDSTNNVSIQLTPTSPVIVDNPIVTSELQPASVNCVDASENVTLLQTDSISNIPFELAPTSPVIANNPIVTSELQSAESVNFVDVPESVVSSPDVTQPNKEIQTIVTPPVLRETTEVTTLDADAMSDDKPLRVYASENNKDNTSVTSAIADVTSPNFTSTSSILPIVVNQEQAIEPDFPSVVKSLMNTSDTSETQTFTAIEQNTVLDNLPVPQGFATGGQVTQSSVENPQIASSDTVPAMLTPGEFVINANDAQKNLHILRHINTGGTPEDIIVPSLEISTEQTPTKVDSFDGISLQRQNSDSRAAEESNSLIPSSLGTEIGKQRLFSHSSLQLNTVENKATTGNKSSPHYSLPTLIFRKPSANTNTSYDTPTQWSSVEQLLNGSNDPFTSFNFSGGESNRQNSEYSQASQSSQSTQVFTKSLTSPKGFANGGEVTAPDIASDIEPITETIQSPSAAIPEADESGNLEALAYEIYNRLRQRIEVERERQGIYLGRLPW